MEKSRLNSFLIGFLGTFLLAGGFLAFSQSAMGSSSDSGGIDCVNDFDYRPSYQTIRLTQCGAELTRSAKAKGWTVKSLIEGETNVYDKLIVILEKK